MSDHHSTPPDFGQPHRRSFFELLTVALGALATLAFAIPVVGYLLGPLLKKRAPEWIKQTWPVTDFPVNETRFVTFDNPIQQPWDGMTANTGVYVRNLGKDAHDKDQFLIFAVNCAHLGCPVSWFPQSGLFMCPCHGGVYYENGDRASGPPPRGLFHVPYDVKDGKLRIQAPFLPTLQDTLMKEDA